MRMQCFVSINLLGGENVSSTNDEFSCGNSGDEDA